MGVINLIFTCLLIGAVFACFHILLTVYIQLFSFRAASVCLINSVRLSKYPMKDGKKCHTEANRYRVELIAINQNRASCLVVSFRDVWVNTLSPSRLRKLTSSRPTWCTSRATDMGQIPLLWSCSKPTWNHGVRPDFDQFADKLDMHRCQRAAPDRSNV